MNDVGSHQPVARLGFGCARLSLAATRRENEAILGAAWDEGIRWFDVARSYSYGGAERLLGRFLTGRRDDATVVTKFGIKPPAGLMANRAVQAGARAAVRVLPGIKGGSVSVADERTTAGDFSVPAAQDSLHRSLRALRTDHVDGLLLHEADLEDARSDDLRAWLDTCIRQGTVRRWGTAVTDLGVTSAICEAVPDATGIVQVPDSLFGPHLDAAARSRAGTLVSHSVLAQDLPRLQFWLRQSPARRAEWSGRLGGDGSTEPSALARMLLATALAGSGNRVVLFSSRSAERCRDAARTPADVSADQITEFGHLLDAVARDLALPHRSGESRPPGAEG